MTVDSRINVEHSNIAEEFRVVLEGELVISLNHLLSDFFFNLFLYLSVVGIRVHHSYLPLLLRLLLVHDLLEAI